MSSGSGTASGVPPAKTHHCLIVAGAVVRLPPGTITLGRDPTCKLTIPNGATSRVHAQVRVTDDSVVLEDLGSANGTLVNEQLLTRPTRLQDGDTILIGTETIRFVERPRDSYGPEPPTLDAAVDDAPQAAAEDQDDTLVTGVRSDALDHVAGLVEKMQALGRMDSAAQLLGEHLDRLRAAARDGDEVDRPVLTRASKLALGLAEASGEARWVDSVIDLHLAAGRPLAASVIERLERLLPSIRGADKPLLRRYQLRLAETSDRMDRMDRLLCNRIDELARALPED